MLRTVTSHTAACCTFLKHLPQPVSSTSDDKDHSLHLTVSAMQQWAWVDLLDIVMPEALDAAGASESSSSLRQGLPRGFLDYMGAMYEEVNDEKLPESLKKVGEEESAENPLVQERRLLKEKFKAEAKKRIMKVAKTVSSTKLMQPGVARHCRVSSVFVSIGF